MEAKASSRKLSCCWTIHHNFYCKIWSIIWTLNDFSHSVLLNIAIVIKKSIVIGIKYMQFLVSPQPSLVTKTAKLLAAALGSANLDFISLILRQGPVMGEYAGHMITNCASVCQRFCPKNISYLDHYLFSVWMTCKSSFAGRLRYQHHATKAAK